MSVTSAMILAAGLGTRLRPLTDELAKPMVPVGDMPAVAHVAARVVLVTRRVVVNVHHRPQDLAPWAAGEGFFVSEETELLGTAGGLARAAPWLGPGDTLVWNADILSAFDPRRLVAAHASHAGRTRSLATLAVRPRPPEEGNVGLSADGRVVRLRGERFGPESRGGEFLGVHVVGAALRSLLPERGCLVGDAYLPALRDGAELFAELTEEPFIDVGTMAQYRAANAAWLAERSLSSWASPSARVTAAIEGSVVGAGAEIHAPCTRSVVWPGAVVRHPVVDAVVTPRVVVAG